MLVGGDGCWQLDTGYRWVEMGLGGSVWDVGGSRRVLVACDACLWLGMGCCWVETGGLGPKTGLGGSERVPVGQEAVLVGLNAALGVERGCR